MLDQVDAALAALLRGGLPDGTAVRFDPPGSWAPDQELPVLDVFLREVREDLEARVATWVDMRDEQGRVVSRGIPPRRFRLCYLVTAWASDVDGEHAVLGSALETLARQEVIPTDHLSGRLLEAGFPVGVNVAHPDLSAAPVDIWAALGTPPRSALDVVVTAPLVYPGVAIADAPGAVALGVDNSVPPPPPPPRTVPHPRKRITERG